MNISIFGLGYVGAVTAACLAKSGHVVVGVDANDSKVADISRGMAPVVEPGLGELLRDAVEGGRLSATTDPALAVARTDASIICVGTPSLACGGLDLSYVNAVCEQIRGALAEKGSRHLLLFRSTVLPGTIRGLAGRWFSELLRDGVVEIVFCPEFLREGSAVRDFGDPALTILGSEDGTPNDLADELMGGATWHRWESAELVKYACNYWHALKVSFANEIGRLGKRIGIDSQVLMEDFLTDTKLNVSPYYMRPGAPFGGSCLPKDVSALRAYARQCEIDLPVLESVMATNEAHLESLVRLVTGSTSKGVMILGLAFKEGTDDLRGSPMVRLAEILIQRGHPVRIFDPNLYGKDEEGGKRLGVLAQFPQIGEVMIHHPGDAMAECDLIVVAHRNMEVGELESLMTAEHRVIDVNGWKAVRGLGASVEGLCW